MKNYLQIIFYAAIVVIMLALVPVIVNDYALTGIYIVFILSAVIFKRERSDFMFLVIGFFGLILGEYFFVSTGVETFNRNSLFGIMPLWLPFLWSFIFLSMKRVFWLLVKDYWHIQLK
mgnify:CR=1 FL=1